MPRSPSTTETVVTTHCPYCALNCGLQLEVERNRIVGLRRWKESPLTGGALCSKGATAHLQVHNPDRLTRPLIKQGSDFVETDWDHALDVAADGFLRIATRYGRHANAVLSGGSLTNEKVYVVGKLARLALGTRHVDYNGRFCMVSAGKAHTMAFGSDRMMTPLTELANAEVAVVVGANLSAAFPVSIPPLLEGIRRRGGRVVVVDPRSSRFVKPGDLHLQLRPGTDALLFSGLLREVIGRGLANDQFIADRTSGFAELSKNLERYDLETVAAATDVPVADLQAAARLIGSTEACMYLHGRGPEQQVAGVQNVLSIINLGLVCGHVGGPGRGINMLTGQRNGQGGREWGQRCDQLPAGRSIEDPQHRTVVAERWGIAEHELPRSGADYTEILRMAGRGEIRGLLAICTNMSVSAPDLRAVERQMASLEHCVVIDPFFSPSAEHATVVLPGSTFAEEAGTITTIEGRVVRCDQAVSPHAGRADLEILCQLADRFGAPEHFPYQSEREVFEEMCSVSAGGIVDYSGMEWDRLRDDGGVFWPCPTPGHPGTPQRFQDSFDHPDGRARFHIVAPTPPPEMVDDTYPYVMTNGRVLAHFLSGNQTMRIPAQQARAAEPVMEVHPETAQACGLVPDERATIASRLGEVEVAWAANPGLRPDTLFLPYHWPICNTLVADHCDPLSKIPAFKYTPVALGPSMDENSESRSINGQLIGGR